MLSRTGRRVKKPQSPGTLNGERNSEMESGPSCTPASAAIGPSDLNRPGFANLGKVHNKVCPSPRQQAITSDADSARSL